MFNTLECHTHLIMSLWCVVELYSGLSKFPLFYIVTHMLLIMIAIDTPCLKTIDKSHT